MNRRALLSVGLLCFAACDFGTSVRTIIFTSQVASVSVVATNTDADTMFLGTNGQLIQADPASGALSNPYVLWGGAASTATAITPDGQNSQNVWALHNDGWVVNWSPGPTVGQFFSLPNFVNGALCDLDHTDDGSFYVTTGQANGATLWRRDGATLQWTWAPIQVAGCPAVTHDLIQGTLFVVRANGHTLERRDPVTLAVLGTDILDLDNGSLRDIDALGGALIGVGESVEGGQGEPPRMAWSFNPATGGTIDAKVLGFASGEPVSAQITINAAASTPELVFSSWEGTGSRSVGGVLLFPPS